jgi:hypothetical protein
MFVIDDDIADTTEDGETTEPDTASFNTNWFLESTDDIIRRARLEMARNIILLKTNREATEDEARKLAVQIAIEDEAEIAQRMVDFRLPFHSPLQQQPKLSPSPQQQPSSPVLTTDGRWIQPKQWPTLV